MQIAMSSNDPKHPTTELRLPRSGGYEMASSDDKIEYVDISLIFVVKRPHFKRGIEVLKDEKIEAKR
jgi:hypothetical protein